MPRPRQFDQLAELLEQAYNLKSGRMTEADLIGSPDPALRSAAAIAALLMRDAEAIPYPDLVEWLGGTVPEVRKAVIGLQSLIHHDPSVDHAVQRFKFALRMLRDYRPVEPSRDFVMPGAFGIVAEQHDESGL